MVGSLDLEVGIKKLSCKEYLLTFCGLWGIILSMNPQNKKIQKILEIKYGAIFPPKNKDGREGGKEFFINLAEYVDTLSNFVELKGVFGAGVKEYFTKRSLEQKDASVKLLEMKDYFYKLFIFKNGYEEFEDFSNYKGIEEKYTSDKEYVFTRKDISNIENVAAGLHQLFETKYGRYDDHTSRLIHLQKSDFENVVKKVHSYFLIKLSESVSEKKIFDFFEGRYYLNGHLINVNKETLSYVLFDSTYRMRPDGGEILYSELKKYLTKNSVVYYLHGSKKSKSFWDYNLNDIKKLVQDNLCGGKGILAIVGIGKYLKPDQDGRIFTSIRGRKGYSFNNTA